MSKATRTVMDVVYSSEGKEINIADKQVVFRKELIDKFVECRKKRGWTQQELSKRSGITRSNITRFESGRYNPTLEMLVRIATALEAELDFNIELQ